MLGLISGFLPELAYGRRSSSANRLLHLDQLSVVENLHIQVEDNNLLIH
jgi:hypothetical protein